jgi:hypothetical protein
VGDLIPDITLKIVTPDGKTTAESMLQYAKGHRTLLYFYWKDNTSL